MKCGPLTFIYSNIFHLYTELTFTDTDMTCFFFAIVLYIGQAMHMTVIGSVHAIWMCCLAMGPEREPEGAQPEA